MSRHLQFFLKAPLLLAGGAGITCLLFYLMQDLINTEFAKPETGVTVDIKLITLPEWEPDPERITPKPDKPETPKDMPPVDIAEVLPSGPANTVSFTKQTAVAPDFTGDSFGITDSNALPIVQIAPTYPNRALQRGLEGYVMIEFDINEEGQVINPSVLYAEPAGVFEQAALAAISRWRYEPRVQDGRKVRQLGLRKKLVFTLE